MPRNRRTPRFFRRDEIFSAFFRRSARNLGGYMLPPFIFAPFLASSWKLQVYQVWLKFTWKYSTLSFGGSTLNEIRRDEPTQTNHDKINWYRPTQTDTNQDNLGDFQVISSLKASYFRELNAKPTQTDTNQDKPTQTKTSWAAKNEHWVFQVSFNSATRNFLSKLSWDRETWQFVSCDGRRGRSMRYKCFILSGPMSMRRES